jgi:hypothetical protein
VSYFEGARSEIFPVAVDQSKEGTVNLWNSSEEEYTVFTNIVTVLYWLSKSFCLGRQTIKKCINNVIGSYRPIGNWFHVVLPFTVQSLPKILIWGYYVVAIVHTSVYVFAFLYIWRVCQLRCETGMFSQPVNLSFLLCYNTVHSHND